MSIINQLDKRSGITYVYESISYWDKEKQQPRAKRKLIGKRDPLSGEILSTDGRGKSATGIVKLSNRLSPGLFRLIQQTAGFMAPRIFWMKSVTCLV